MYKYGINTALYSDFSGRKGGGGDKERSLSFPTKLLILVSIEIKTIDKVGFVFVKGKPINQIIK